MKDDPIVAEVRKVREAMLEEAGHDLDRLCDTIEQNAAKRPHTGLSVRTAEELRRIVEQQEAANAVLEKPQTYGKDLTDDKTQE